MKKINVLQFICPAGLYGAEMWILALARKLDPEKVNCELAVTFESKDQNIEIEKRFRRLGLVSHIIEMAGRFDPLIIPKLVALVKKKKIDIIHTHGYKSDIIGLMVSKIAGIKAVATPHGFENMKDLKLKLFMWLGGVSLRFFDEVVPLSEELRKDILKLGVDHRRVKLIMNGVDIDEIESEKKCRIGAEFGDRRDKKIGYVGQMAYRKNVGDLITAFDLLNRMHKDVKLILIGDGPMRGDLEKYANSLPSSEQIEFTGYREDRLKIVKELDLFCMTSSLEGIPRSMMEAMCMGVAVAAYNIPGVDRLIIHEKTGLLSPLGDVEKLKDSFGRLLFDPEFSGLIKANGKSHIYDNFSNYRMAEEYTKLYNRILPSAAEG